MKVKIGGWGIKIVVKDGDCIDENQSKEAYDRLKGADCTSFAAETDAVWNVTSAILRCADRGPKKVTFIIDNLRVVQLMKSI